jgi:hypothetical protein
MLSPWTVCPIEPVLDGSFTGASPFSDGFASAFIASEFLI